MDDLSWSKIDWGQADANGVASNARLAQYTTDFMMQKLSTNSVGNYTTTPDGPYNSENAEFGLVVSKIVDNVNFNTLDLDDRGVKFTQQPDFRYGRMSLQDIGGNSDQDIDIPLRTEFWDSAERSFITNSDDRRSSYLSNQRYCRQTLWSNEGASNASLVGNGAVDEGLDDNLSATHTANSTTHRSQVRLWLRQGTTSPQVGESGVDCSNGGSYTDQPWLQYNWRNVGDEDPSTVVTFGTFRGNDRIIFRGERGFLPIKTGFFGR
ncbi:MSHA biogenesis protein mshQ [Vibrio sp. JCM 19236]|nr:MSHA biogenesis protein mshQ [Vibrio sp. JCM 19236]